MLGAQATGADGAPLDVRRFRDIYLPRGKQRPFLYAFEREMYRTYVLAWHRRYGKDRTILNAAWQKVMTKGWVIWHGFPEFSQGREVFWDAVDKRTGRRVLEDVLPYTTKVNDQRMILWFGDIYYQVFGFDRYNARVGAGPACIIYSEFATSPYGPMARNYFRPMVMENKGTEVFASTFRGENHFAGLIDYGKAYPSEVFVSELTISDTQRDAPGEQDFGLPVMSEADIEEERRMFKTSGGKMGMSEEMIQQEFYNSREGVNVGKVFGKELRDARAAGQITHVPHDPSKLVHTAWDRGVHNRIWFWQDGLGMRRYIDYLSTDHSSLYEIQAKLKEAQRVKYNYGTHWVAEDAIHLSPWHPESGVKLAESLGIIFKIVPNIGVLTGIDRAKARIATSLFDARHCEDGLNDLREYEWAKNAQFGTMKEPNKAHPASHGADAYRYSAIAGSEPEGPQRQLAPPTPPRHWQGV